MSERGPDLLAESELTNVIGKLSLGVGLLYFVGYTLYVLTLWDYALFFPPVFLAAYLFNTTPFDGFTGSTFQRVGLYTLVIPGGAIAVEALSLLVHGMVFELSWILPPVAWYQRQWLNVVGFTGPLPLLVYTLFTAMIASILALVVRFIWDVPFSLDRDS